MERTEVRRAPGIDPLHSYRAAQSKRAGRRPAGLHGTEAEKAYIEHHAASACVDQHVDGRTCRALIAPAASRPYRSPRP
eukprot:571582-Prymnesium_polylepis.1